MDNFNKIWKVRNILSTAEEYLDGEIVKRYEICEVEDTNGNDVGYTLHIFSRDVDIPHSGLVPTPVSIVTKDLDALENVLAGIVPDETYSKPVVVNFNWKKK